MKTDNVSTLKIHKLTQAQYDRALASGNIDENALYLTPDEGVDLSDYAKKTDLALVQKVTSPDNTITENTDLLTLGKGEYRCTTATIAKTLVNCPTETNFKLTIEERQGTTRLFMTLKDANGEVYHNAQTGNTAWTGWKKVATNTDITNIQTELDKKATSSHTHKYAGSSSAGGAATTALECTGNSESANYTKNIRITDTNPTSATYYYPTLTSGINADTNYVARGNNGFRYRTLEGTTDDNGYGSLWLGNSSASGTDGNKFGVVVLYSTGTGYCSLRATESTGGSYVNYLPAKGGTLLNSNTYMNYYPWAIRQSSNNPSTAISTDEPAVSCNGYDGSSESTLTLHPTDAVISKMVPYLGTSSNRWKTIYLTSAATVSSDERIKTNFHSFESMEDAFMEFEPVLYNFRNVSDNDNHDRSHGGFKAQQIESVYEKYGIDTTDYAFLCKDDVNKFNNGNEENFNPYEIYGVDDYLYSLKYEEMIPFNTHMIQKAFKTIDEQNEKINSLEDRIAKLEALLENK